MSLTGKWRKTFVTADCPVGTNLDRGMFYRSMGMGRFIKDVEGKGFKIFGIVFDEENNCEFIFMKPEFVLGGKNG